MAEEVPDALQDSLRQVAAAIDLSAVVEADNVKDPLLIMVRDEVLMGSTPEEALTTVVDKLTKFGGTILEILDYPPNATYGYALMKKLEAEGLTPDEMNAAVDVLKSTDEIDEINGWWIKVPKPRVRVEDLTDDDIDWLRGTGRFAQ